MENKEVIILLGPPGAGKGTQGKLLSDKLGLYYFETSKILERVFNQAKKGEFIRIKKEKYFLEKEKHFWENGALCDPPFVSYFVEKAIKRLCEMGENLVIAGSPRTLEEAKTLMPILRRLYNQKNIKIFLIDIPAQETIFRNSHRRICELMRHPILYVKETKNLKICPLDGSKLIRRKGLDDPETIKKRLIEYKKRTFPLIRFFEERGIRVKKINGIGSVAQIFRRILKEQSKNKLKVAR